MESTNKPITKGEIDIHSLIMRVLLRWRILFLCGIIFAVIAGGYSYYSQRKAVLQWKKQENADAEKEAFNGPDYTIVRERILQSINEKKEYFNNSILLKLDPSQVGRAYVDCYVETERLLNEKASYIHTNEELVEKEEGNDESSFNVYVMNNMTPAMREASQILDHYSQFIIRNIDYSEISAKYNTTEQYLRELVSISYDRDMLRIIIATSYYDEAGAEEILNYVISALKNHYQDAVAEFGDHRLILKNQSSLIMTDTGLIATNVATRATEFNTLMKQYNDLKTNEGVLDVSAAEPKPKPVMSRMKMLKFTVGGFIGGVVLEIIISIIMLMAGKKVLSARDFNAYYGFRKLGVLPSNRVNKLNGVDRKIFASELKYQSNPSREKCIEIVNNNIKSVLGKDGKVALVSDLSIDALEKLTADLTKTARDLKYYIVGDLSEPSMRRNFDECDCAVFLAETMKSRYGEISDLVQEVTGGNKPILGSIVV